ncbi:MAG: response regulator transcription factor [Pyrinomonadaceae bacterium]|nr:response regulator transcription factor [Pyrinomonadaceae bacterium]
MKKLRILIAEDHLVVRGGLKLLINSNDDMFVVGDVDDGRKALDIASKIEADVLIADISMPELNGLDLVKKLRSSMSDLKIITLTRHSEGGYVRQLIQAGVNGYVLKQSEPSVLLNAIRAVGEGNCFLDPQIALTVMNSYARNSGGIRGAENTEITEREEEVLRHTARGYSNKEIGARLGISVKTVETHKSNGMRKLGANDRVDVVNYAIFQGWMTEE